MKISVYPRSQTVLPSGKSTLYPMQEEGWMVPAKIILSLTRIEAYLSKQR